MNDTFVAAPAARLPGAVVRGALAKYAAVAALSFRQRIEERAALVGRIMFYFIILLTYSRLWQAVLPLDAAAAPGQHRSASPASYVWYLAVTEWIVLSQPSVWLDIEADIRSGDVAYQLSRPISYAGAKFAEALGDMALRLIVLGATGLSFARLFSGGWPSPEGLWLVVLVGPIASVVILLAHLAIGLMAFWLYDCNSVYLIWQKLMFVLGGLMLPLDIYPDGFRRIAEHTPFAALLFRPGSLMLEPEPALALRLIAELTGWGAFALLVVIWLERQGRRIITVSGG
jgi:ABC-2 type transport system permease protein